MRVRPEDEAGRLANAGWRCPRSPQSVTRKLDAPNARPSSAAVTRFRIAFVGAARDALPARGPGADAELEAVLLQDRGGGRERVPGLVAPEHRHRVARELGRELPVLLHEVAPELDAAAAIAGERVHAVEELEVDAALPARLACGSRSPGPDVEGLVEPDVEPRTPEAREELVVESG
jgi:hypothetical protein